MPESQNKSVGEILELVGAPAKTGSTLHALPCTLSPLSHQLSGTRLALRNSRFGLYDEPGCGKTLIAQLYGLYYADYGNKVLVLMPPILLQQFKRSMADTFPGYDEHFHLHILTEGPLPAKVPKKKVIQIKADVSSPEEVAQQYRMPVELVQKIRGCKHCNQQSFTFREAMELKASDRTAKQLSEQYGCSTHAVSTVRTKTSRDELYKNWDDTGWPDFLCMSYQMFLRTYRDVKNAGYQVVVADEAHYLKKASSTTHKAVGFILGPVLGESALLLMTGTPIPNTLEDAYGMTKLTNPKAYSDKRMFERTHCVYENRGDFSQLTGFMNTDLLRINMYAKARRVTKDKVLKLKKPLIQELPVQLSPKHKALYRKLVRERFLEVEGELIDATTAQSLRQKCLRMVTVPEQFSDIHIDNAVKDMVMTLLDSLGVERKEKVVLFANYRNTVEGVAEWCKELNPAVVYGGSGNAYKQVEKFLGDDSCRVLVANPQSGGVGLNLQSVCRYVIFVEPVSVPGEFTQASERVYRSGQTEQVVMYIIRAEGTLAPAMTINMLRKAGETKGINMDKQTLLDELMGEVHDL